MAVIVVWDDEAQSVLRLSLAGYWTWEELYNAGLSLHAMCIESPHRVDILSDSMHMNYRPPRTGEAAALMAAPLQEPANVNMVVFVVNEFTQCLLSEQIKALPQLVSHAFAYSLDEARELIARSRQGENIPVFFPHDRQLN
ncbi:MAG TPA: hypothetical protein VER79_07525 [Candidatus Limnocylindrales bacterium]|nr:hypothetical protein [Candidatus Limnocylindrales bacterium]